MSERMSEERLAEFERQYPHVGLNTAAELMAELRRIRTLAQAAAEARERWRTHAEGCLFRRAPYFALQRCGSDGWCGPGRVIWREYQQAANALIDAARGES